MTVEWDRELCFNHWQATVADIGDSTDEHGDDDTIPLVDLFIEDMNETLEDLHGRFDPEAEHAAASIQVVADMFRARWEKPEVRRAAIDIFELLKGEITLDTLHGSTDIMRKAAGTLPV